MIKFISNPCDSKRITSPYGMRIHPISKKSKMHKGIDFGIMLSKFEPIYSVSQGKVVNQGWSKARGNFVVIQHNGFATLYQHLDSYRTKKGQYVNGGQVIGKMGSSGESTGVHLHFELFDGTYLSFGNKNIDPKPYLIKMEKETINGY